MLSKGHANTALGAVLAQAGFVDDGFLDTFYGFESLFGMHPDIKVPGVEMSTGGLGHGLSVGLGMALGARLQRNGARTVVMLGDGELQEGSNWEAAMAAAHLAPLSLTAIVDYNKVQQSGHVAEMLGLEPLADKWRAFGWQVGELDGHDMEAIVDALDALPEAPDKPSLLIAHTVKGKGTSFAEDSYLWAQQCGERRGLREGHGRVGRPGMSAQQQGNGAEPAWVKAAANQTRLAFGLALTELGRRDERVVAVSADTLDLIGLRGFIDHAPERVIDVGIAEQNAMGVAAGLATTGAPPLRLRLRALHFRALHGAGAERGRLCESTRGDRRRGERGLARRLGRHPSCAGGFGGDAEFSEHDGAGAGRCPRGVACDARDR